MSQQNQIQGWDFDEILAPPSLYRSQTISLSSIIIFELTYPSLTSRRSQSYSMTTLPTNYYVNHLELCLNLKTNSKQTALRCTRLRKLHDIGWWLQQQARGVQRKAKHMFLVGLIHQLMFKNLSSLCWTFSCLLLFYFFSLFVLSSLSLSLLFFRASYLFFVWKK